MSLGVNLYTDRIPAMDLLRNHMEALDSAGNMLEKNILRDNSSPPLIQVTQIAPQGLPTVSGLDDMDYPSIQVSAAGLFEVKQMKTINKVPLPPEVMEHFSHMQCNCMMGLFTEIDRAWLTIDGDIYVWNYEHGSDIAYFDGLGETIMSVGLIKPKHGVFHSFVKYLLVLATTVEIAVLGVTFTSAKDGLAGHLGEMNLLPEPVFVVPTDGVSINMIVGTSIGRIFLGGRDGSLFEIMYQASGSWFGRRYKKVNHSTGTLSFLVPAFINAAFSDDEAIAQLVVDESRHALYCLTDKGAIQVWDLGATGSSISRVTSSSQSAIVQSAVNIVKTMDGAMFRPLVSLCVILASESLHLNLIAVTQTGVRLYFSTGSVSNTSGRPFTLQLMHVRLPPGFAGNAISTRPSNAHMALYSKGSLVLVTAPGGDHDLVWCLSRDPYPFNAYLMEAQTVIPVDGVVWAMAEVTSNRPRHELHYISDSRQPLPDPPLVVSQHTEPPVKFVVLTSQGAEIMAKLRPVDMLREVLTESHGPDSDMVRSYFAEQRPDQGCATSLILACNERSVSIHVSEWATRAFFMYGGEPKMTRGPSYQPPQDQNALPAGFNPAVMSTPYSSMHRPSIAVSPVAPANVSFNPNVSISSPNPFASPFPAGPAAPGLNLNASATTPLHHTMQSLSPGEPRRRYASTPSSSFQFSAKHDGLYLFLGRILRPLWGIKVVRVASPDKDTQYLSSSVARDECMSILAHLQALRSFLDKNTQFSQTGILNLQLQEEMSRRLQDPYETPAGLSQEAQVEEKRSLDALKALILHSCEVVGLWKVLCEHQFHMIAACLNKDQQAQLVKMTFSNLILLGQDMCSLLINSLINSYLNDDASVDSISSKLREVCPNLYRSEDAACSKANEMLLSVKNLQNLQEKQTKLKQALKLCMEVAPNINLSLICHWFVTSQYYEAVLELCLVCATKGDPKNIAVHYYKCGEPADDREGFQVMARRMACYKELTLLLDQLYQHSLSSPHTPSIPSTPGVCSPAVTPSCPLSPTQADAEAKRLTLLALQSPDELCHIAVYDWMISKGLHGDLVSVTQPSLEQYLSRGASRNPDNLELSDLQWQHYERQGNHLAAARILHRLATKADPSILLKQRVVYLARAVMCMRSDCSSAQQGVMLRELEDQVDVARIQQQVMDGVANLKGKHPQAEAALVKLNSGLFEITQLYEEFAEVFDLWTCKLAIIHCSGHTDPLLIETVWSNIVDSELSCSVGRPPDDRMSVVLGLVKGLGREYMLSPLCFPIAFLVRILELQSCRLGADRSLVLNTMLSLGVSLVKLFEVYERMIALSDRCWVQEGDELHLIRVVANLVKHFVQNPNITTKADRRSAIARAGDILANCLTTLYSKPDTGDLIGELRGVQSQLQRLGNSK